MTGGQKSRGIRLRTAIALLMVMPLLQACGGGNSAPVEISDSTADRIDGRPAFLARGCDTDSTAPFCPR